MPKLTKSIVESLKPHGRDSFVWCDALPGFGVRVFASGKRSYLVQYRAGGRTRRVSIGLHGHVTCDAARKKAKQLLGRVAAGDNPADDRDAERKAMTVKQLCEAYLAAAKKGLILGKRGLSKKASTLATDRGRIARHILPLLGIRKVRDLTPPDIAHFMRDVMAGKTASDVRTRQRGRAIVRGGKGAAARTVGLLGGILSYAVSEGIIPANPARGVKRPADQRRRVRLSSEEYGALGAALRAAEAQGERWQVVGAVHLLALTGCRRGEVENLRWEDVDFVGGCLRLSDSKTGRSVRPLGDAAAAVLRALPRTNSEFVFPGAAYDRDANRRGDRMQDTPFRGLPKAFLRVKGIAATLAAKARRSGGDFPELNDLTPHGLRHAFASTAADLGLSEITIAALLGHSTATITSRYIHQVDAALIDAATRVAVHIAACMKAPNQTAEIIVLRQA